MRTITTFGARPAGGRIRQFNVAGLTVQIQPTYEEDNDAAGALAEFLAAAADAFEASRPPPTDVGQIERESSDESCEATCGVYTDTHQTAATSEEPMNATTNTFASLTTGTRVLVVKGCAARELAKNVTARIESITPMGADYGHCVRVVLVPVNGFKAGKAFAFYARHVNRLADPIVRMNDGIPSHVIEVRRA